ncbi:MAG TPA: transglutaminase family protein [Lapillicoccus sp.]|nr:transglutaminase family protein [Lapillicoccus sp.]
MSPATSQLDGLERVAYRLEQTFQYHYSAPIRTLRHRLHVVPPAQHGPTSLVTSRLIVDGADVHRRRWRDGAGNTVVRVRADRVEEYVRFSYSATLSRQRDGASVLLDRAALADPRWRRTTPLTAPSEPLRALALASSPTGEAPWDRLSGLALADHLNQAAYHALDYEWGVTGVRTTAHEALVLGRGVCQDFAHLMLALCRIRGLPARYVSGHLVGQGGTHAWVEVLVPAADGRAAEAVGYDPCNGRRTGAGHVTVATGRDYRDVPPTSGTYVGKAAGHLTTRRDLVVLDAA